MVIYPAMDTLEASEEYFSFFFAGKNRNFPPPGTLFYFRSWQPPGERWFSG
jgi:hypothetical protein